MPTTPDPNPLEDPTADPFAIAAQAAQQTLDEKEQLDERNRLMNQAIYFQQNFPTLIENMTSGVSDSIHAVSLSTTGH